MNSLLAFGVLFARAYAEATGHEHHLPTQFVDLVRTNWAREERWGAPDGVERLWDRQTLVVLHGPETLPAAIDIESKFTEAALGSVQLADFRHFAHGRHHWLAKRRRETAVLALTTTRDREVGERTLVLLPPDVPVARIDVPSGGWLAALMTMVRCFGLAASAGTARGFDPGDPGVPTFGRDLYRLNVYPFASTQALDDIPSGESVAIERKAGEPVETLAAAGRLPRWRSSYAEVVERLAAARYVGIVFDYDGTLCDEAERYGPVPADSARELVRILEAGCVVGITTGRGRSVRDALRGAIPDALWGRVLVGYYNGGDIGSLADDEHPDGRQVVDAALQPFTDLLDALPLLFEGMVRENRLRQITLTPPAGSSPERLWDVTSELIRTLPGPWPVALRSGHSVDIVAPGVSKTAVVAGVRELAGGGPTAAVLCIGDRGRWPGNDYALLAEPHSLSVDEVSVDPTTGWNLAPGGHRGRQATVGYLRLLNKTRTGLRLATSRLGGGR